MDMNTAVQDTMEFLSRVRKLRSGIENKMRRIETLREMATGTTVKVSDMPRSDSPNLQRMETVLCKAADLELEIAQDELTLEHVRQEIVAAIGQLPDYREEEVLYGRYVKCRSWEMVAELCGYSKRTVLRKHHDGVEHLTGLMARKDTTLQYSED